jgi:hypothetical protein
MSKPYKIKDAKVTAGLEIEVTIKCTPEEVESFEFNLYLPYNIAPEAAIARLNEIVNDEIAGRIEIKNGQHAADEELKIKENKCKLIKDKILELRE